MDTKVCLDLQRFVARSAGVFGKSGTGKTFLTRLLLVGIVQRNTAVNLIFDMHNEYGWKGNSERENHDVKGLRQLFGTRVAIFTLDEKSSLDRGASADEVCRSATKQIEPEDIALLRETLNMTDAQIESIHRLDRLWGHAVVRQVSRHHRRGPRAAGGGYRPQPQHAQRALPQNGDEAGAPALPAAKR
jgi:ABC-type glutathione transport system ATPase component